MTRKKPKSKKKQYRVVLYNAKGSAKKLATAEGFEIYYGDTLKYPKKFTWEIPPFPDDLPKNKFGKISVKSKAKFIEDLILAIDKKRLRQLVNNQEYRERQKVVKALDKRVHITWEEKKPLTLITEEKTWVKKLFVDYHEPINVPNPAFEWEGFWEAMSQIRDDFITILDMTWHKFAKLERRFILKIFTPNYDKKNNLFMQRIVYNNINPPSEGQLREFERRGYDINAIREEKTSGGFRYRYIVTEKIDNRDAALHHGFSLGRTMRNMNKEQLLEHFDRTIYEWAMKLQDYFQRNYVKQIKYAGLLLECIGPPLVY